MKVAPAWLEVAAVQNQISPFTMASTSPDRLQQLAAGLKSTFPPRQQEPAMNVESGAESVPVEVDIGESCMPAISHSFSVGCYILVTQIYPQGGEYVDTPYGRVLVTIQVLEALCL